VDRPLISPSGDLEDEAPVAQRGDHQPAPHVGGVGLGVARRTERHQAVEIEVRAALGALDDVVDFEGAPAATGLAAPAGPPEHYPSDRRPLLEGGRRAPRRPRAAILDSAARRGADLHPRPKGSSQHQRPQPV
jgi:hypothetical protein